MSAKEHLRLVRQQGQLQKGAERGTMSDERPAEPMEKLLTLCHTIGIDKMIALSRFSYKGVLSSYLLAYISGGPACISPDWKNCCYLISLHRAERKVNPGLIKGIA